MADVKRARMPTWGKRLLLLCGLLSLCGVGWFAWRSMIRNTRRDYFSMPLTSSGNLALARELVQIQKALTDAVSQKEYDELIPPFCEHTTRLMWQYVASPQFCDWSISIRSDLARKPLLKVLRGKDPVRIPAAGFLAAACKVYDATPLLIELVTTRFHAEVWPEYRRQLVIVEICRALGRLASSGDKRAANFLLKQSKVDAWKDISFTMSGMNREESARYVWCRFAGGLAYYPSMDTINALQESGYEHASNRVALIRGFLESGDSVEQYHREILLKGLTDNKYFHWTGWDNINQVGHGTRYSGRVQWVRELQGTNDIGTRWRRGADFSDLKDSYGFTNWVGKTEMTYSCLVTNWVPTFAAFGVTNLISTAEGAWANGTKNSTYFFHPTNSPDAMVALRVLEREDVTSVHNAMIGVFGMLSTRQPFPLGTTSTIQVGDRCYIGYPTNSCGTVFFVRNNVFLYLDDTTHRTSYSVKTIAEALDNELKSLSLGK